MTKVLVTGATGFIASHLILELRRKGYTVRGAARCANKAAHLNRAFSDYSGEPFDTEVAPTDLTSGACWKDKVCEDL